MAASAVGVHMWISPTTKSYFQTNRVICSFKGKNQSIINHVFSSQKTRGGESVILRAKKTRESVVVKSDEGIEEDDEIVEEKLGSKPKGFGSGKVYDVSLEDLITAEIKQNRKAQKSDTLNMKEIDGTYMADIQVKTKKKADIQVEMKKKRPPNKIEVPELAKNKTMVWIGNLPKKKNIDRDLRLALKEFPGLLEINPVVDADERTRDPICKGIAFVSFGNENFANRFLTEYHNRKVTFGKVERRIACRLAGTKDSKMIPFVKTVSSSTKGTVSRLKTINEKENDTTASSNLKKNQRKNDNNVAPLHNQLRGFSLPSVQEVKSASSDERTNSSVDVSDNTVTLPTLSNLFNSAPSPSIPDAKMDSRKAFSSDAIPDKKEKFTGSLEKILNDVSEDTSAPTITTSDESTFQRHEAEYNDTNVNELLSENCTEQENLDDSNDILVSSEGKQKQMKAQQILERKSKRNKAQPSKEKGLTLGSALRLKKKDRGILTSVLHKYGKQAVKTSQ